MIFYGWGKKTAALGELGDQSCPRCGGFRPFRAVLSYKYFHLYWIFGLVTGRKYIAACNGCGQGALLESSQVAHLNPDEKIPFMEKWGLGIFLVLIAVILTFAAVRR